MKLPLISVLPMAILLVTGLTGCVNQIGKNEFACPNGTTKSDGVCAGPRKVYELTNNREDLSGLSHDPEFAHLRPTSIGEKTNPRREANGEPNNQTAEVAVEPRHRGNADQEEVTVYKPRDLAQHSPDDYQRAEAIPQQRFERHQNDQYQGWPNHEEALAPEPLAVIEAPEVMRVLVAAWPDNAGNLNMPGYVYVEVTERRFNVGSAANKRPSRVVPFEMRQQSQEEIRRQEQRSRGVSPIGVENPYSNNPQR